MGRYLDRLYCMMVATVSSYVVNMVCQINSAFATGCVELHASGPGAYFTWRCSQTSGGISQDLYDAGNIYAYPNWGYSSSTCDVSAASVSMSATAMVSNGSSNIQNYLSERGFSGLRPSTCFPDPASNSCIGNGGCYVHVTNNSSYVEIRCYYANLVMVDIGQTQYINCGFMVSCQTNGRVDVTCNSVGSSAGYKVGSSSCVCCPKGTGVISYTSNGDGPGVFSIYNASAASQCYMTGKFKDDSGLFEFTDSNRCYYAS